MTKRNGIYAGEFTHRSIRIPPSPELDATRIVCFQIYEYSGLTATECHATTGGNKIKKSGVQTPPST
jgi:hypothetical protein